MKEKQPLDQTNGIVANTINHTAKVLKNSKLEGSILEKLYEFSSSIPDFRRAEKGNIRHKLSDIIMLLILGRVSNCVSRAEIIEFGKHNLKSFRKLDILANGIPSEATLCRMEEGIDDQAMANQLQVFGRNPDIVSAHSFNTDITLATEACEEKSNEIKAVPLLIDKIDISGKIVTADAMSMQKDIVDKIREKNGDFIIELKSNQRSLRYGVEDKIKELSPVYSYCGEPELGHGRIETRSYRVFDGTDLIANKEKWNGNLTIIEYECETVKKSTGSCTTEKRLHVSSLPANTPRLGTPVRNHWSIESMHWGLDRNLLQDKIKRKSARAARNLDTIQRIVYSVFSIWRGRRKKKSDKRKGMAELMRHISLCFTKLLHFLYQK